MIVDLHNEASSDEVYATSLYTYCRELVDQGKVPEGFDDQVYVLSIDWPLDFTVARIIPE